MSNMLDIIDSLYIVLKLYTRKGWKKNADNNLNEMEVVWLCCTDVDTINHALCSKLKTFYTSGWL